ncbi:MAG: immunoglobulin-like domain-containing protein, partial [Bacilli bacterium]
GYLELANNYDTYANKLVKFVNPYMNYSTSSTPSVTNWVRLGYDVTSGDAGHGTGTNVHYYAFLIAAQNEALGTDTWHTMYDIPFYNAGAKQFEVTIYAYALYVSETYIAFVIPDWDCYQVSGVDAISVALSRSLPATIENGTINLLTAHELVEGNVVWTSSDDNVINSLTGKVTEVSENTEVTLTATFKYQGTTYVREYKVSVLKAEAMSVTDLLASGTDSQAVKVRGIIVGYVSDGNTVDTRMGVLILDNETGKTVMVNGLSSLGGFYGAYLDSTGNLLAVGDEILVVGTYYLNTAAIGTGPEQTGRNYIEVTADSTVTLLGKPETINYQNALVVTNQEEMQALADNLVYGAIIKLVGTEENPLFLGGSSSKLPFNIKLFYNKEAVDNNGTKYNGKIFSLKSDTNEANAGSEWYNTMFSIPTAFVGPSETVPAILVTGDLYVVLGYTTSTYYQMSMVNAQNCTMSRILTYEQFTDLLARTLPTTVVSQTLDFSLPSTHSKVTGPITWSSENNTLINPATWAIGTVTANTDVKLTASFTYDGQARTYEHTVTVFPVPAAAPLSVSKALEEGVAGMSLGITGIIVAYHADGNTSGVLRGVVLMDEVTHQTILIDGMELIGTSTHGLYQASNGNLLAVGDKIVIESATFAAAGNRQSVEVSATSAITVSSSSNTIVWDVDNAITISTNAQMQEFANSLQFGKVIKLVGTTENPICTGGSSTKLPFNIKLFFNKDAVDNDGTKYNSKTFALKTDINDFNGGSDWWKTLFGFTGPFVGPKDTVGPIKFTGTLYVVLSAETSTYYQMAIVNFSAASLTPLNN